MWLISSSSPEAIARVAAVNDFVLRNSEGSSCSLFSTVLPFSLTKSLSIMSLTALLGIVQDVCSRKCVSPRRPLMRMQKRLHFLSSVCTRVPCQKSRPQRTDDKSTRSCCYSILKSKCHLHDGSSAALIKKVHSPLYQHFMKHLRAFCLPSSRSLARDAFGHQDIWSMYACKEFRRYIVSAPFRPVLHEQFHALREKCFRHGINLYRRVGLDKRRDRHRWSTRVYGIPWLQNRILCRDWAHGVM